MKRIIIILVSFLLFQCSFDNKTGIWKNDNDININQKDIYRDFKKLNTEEKVFNEIIEPGNNLKIIVEPTKKNIQWLDEFYQNSNNLDNYITPIINLGFTYVKEYEKDIPNRKFII